MKGLRSVIIGMHNPIIHGFLVVLAWRMIYRASPSIKELVCILLHDVGYIKKDFIDGEDDRHPELGAKICGYLFGEEYYILCITHSRDNLIYKPLIYLGGEAQEYHKTTKTKKWGYPIDTKLIKEDYKKWWNKNGLKSPEG